MARQAGFAQVTKTGAVAFHWERRCRVLLRDIRLLGTATFVLLATSRLRFSGPDGPETSVVAGIARYIVSLLVAALKPE